MEFFKKSNDVYGKYCKEELHKATEDFFEISRRIKQKLGDKSYKLDRYLGWVLEIANNRLVYDAADSGFMIFGELWGLCTGILNYDSEITDHEFYGTAKDFIQAHRFQYKENHTLSELYCALLTPQFTDYAVKKFTEDVKQRVNQEIDTILVYDYSKLIIDIVGEEEMAALNKAITDRFIISSILNSFLQAITNEYLYCLLHRDPETSKQVFQLMMGGKM